MLDRKGLGEIRRGCSKAMNREGCNRPFDELETLVLPVRGISLRNKLMNECQEVVSTTLGCCKVIVEAIWMKVWEPMLAPKTSRPLSSIWIWERNGKVSISVGEIGISEKIADLVFRCRPNSRALSLIRGKRICAAWRSGTMAYTLLLQQ